jgi:PAS domain S-box-containing protein
MKFLSGITKSGVSHAHSPSERRNVILTNYISLLAAMASILLLIGRYFFAYTNWSIIVTLAEGCLIFLLPVAMNRMGYIHLSRLALCWLPAAHQFYAILQVLHEVPSLESSMYVGLRFFLLTFCCFPFLVYDIRQRGVFILGLSGPLFFLFFLDPLLVFFNVGYSQMGLLDTTYYFNNVRVVISFLIIGSSLYFLKDLIEKSEAEKEKLISELAAKNIFIQQQAETEVHQLNQILKQNLQELNEREFILNQSQRIAKIGSWEYRIENDFLFWSDAMYDLVGLDKSFDLKRANLNQALGQEGSEQLSTATVRLLQTGESFDITIRTKTPIGYTKWFRVYSYPILDQYAIIGVRGICHDITFFKEAEEKLRAGEAKFSKVFENYPEFIMVVREVDLMVVDVNSKITAMLGFEKHEVLGRSARAMDLFLTEEERQSFIKSYLAEGYTDYECQWKRKDGRIIEVKITGIRIDIDGQYYRMSVVDDITEQKHTEREKEHVRYLLNERIKELTTLYGVSQILRDEKKTSREMLEEVVSVLPLGWQYPEITVARIELGSEAFSSSDFPKAVQKQTARFNIQPNTKGVIEIGYTEEKPEETEGPFFSEERKLLNMIAEMLEEYFARKHEQESLVEAQANLKATINNTEIMIWSVDRQFQLLTFNDPFFQYIKKYYGVEIKIGNRVLDQDSIGEVGKIRSNWSENYSKALNGEIVTLEENRFSMNFHFSLNPIIEHNMIIGVSVFADNITERNRKDLELREANKKIGELKLMALRSVMSPHFIFNVLNSIQFFIAKNDRLNAITYLSTFSKLIRGILTHSVNNKIKLTDEIEMLKNYVQLEMVRFENKINFILNVHPDLDTDSIEIPSLLIQPYVENAILHGLYNKPEGGTLMIDIYEENDVVFFQIEDNGVGREAALKLRDQNFPTHKSMGIKITEERLQLINQKDNVAFEIHDLMTDGKPSGTRVRIGVVC